MRKTHSIPARRQAMAPDLSLLVRKAMIGALQQVGRINGVPLAPLQVEPAATPVAPQRMAAAQTSDAATRSQLTASYEACLRSYRSMAHAQGGAQHSDDVGAAVALFVAVNLHALHGVDVSAEALRSLELQLRGVARLAANWNAASLAERQFFFERAAILATLMSGSHAGAAAQGPGVVAYVKRTAREYLQQLLGLDPDLLTLHDDGLALRDEAVASAPLGTPAHA